MHELALMTSLVERVCEIAGREEAARIITITVIRGELSGVIPEALTFCFDVCVAGTCAEGARLEIREEAAAWSCRQCGAACSIVEETVMPLCPACGSQDLELKSGREFRLESIEVE